MEFLTMTKRLTAPLCGTALLALVACGHSDHEEGSEGQGGEHAHATSSITATTGTAGGGGAGSSSSAGGGANTTPPDAPIMEQAAKMEGALHVSWENVTTDCDLIHLARNEDGGAFAEVYALVGVADNQHDTGATDSAVTYCYKATCERDSLSSPDSNEVCGTP